MTRINLLPVSELNNIHLMAEYRELPMVPAALRRSLKTQTPEKILKKIPGSFTLNQGHVTFFYNKLGYLQKRYHEIIEELQCRGFNLDPDRESGFHSLSSEWYGDYRPSTRAMNIVRDRIVTRIKENELWYASRGVTV